MRKIWKGIEGITILFSILDRIVRLEVIGELLALIFLNKGRLNEAFIALVDVFGAVLLRNPA